MATYDEGETLPEPYPTRPSKDWLERNRQGVISMAEDVAKGQEKVAAIKFKAHVWKVGTLGTGGLRVQLNLDQEFIKEMAMLAECQHELKELEFEARESE